MRAHVLAHLLRAGSVAEAELRLHLISTMSLHGRVLGRDELSDLLEELRLPLSRRVAVRLLVDAELAEETDKGLRVAVQVSDEALLAVPADIRPMGLSLGALAQWVELLEDRPVAGAASAHLVVDVIGRSAAWAAEITEEAGRLGLEGLPVFWIPKDPAEGGGYRPETTDIGSIASVDGLLMVIHGMAVDPSSAPQLGPAAVRLVNDLVAMQRNTDDWYDGVEITPMWDDDFVGTLVAEHADLGPCPTLDATACLATGVAAALASPVADDLGTEAREAVARAVRCVVRWQEPDGSWAIHRYDPADGRPPMRSRTLSFGYAVEAMASARPHVDVDLGDAPKRALEHLRCTAHYDGAAVHWRLDVGDEPSPGDLGATAFLVPAIIALRELCGEDVDDLLIGAVDHLRANWRPDATQPFEVAFRVPTWDGPALDVFQWELPLDPIVLSALVADERGSARLDHEDRERVAAAVGYFLAGCQPGGFWLDILKEREGDVQGMTGNSDFFQKALVDHLRDEGRLYRSLVRVGSSALGTA